MKTFTVVCDRCESLLAEPSGNAAWGNGQLAAKVAHYSGWLTEGPRHYCRLCCTTPDGAL